MESTNQLVPEGEQLMKHIQASLQSDNPYGVPKYLVLKLLEEYNKVKK